MTPHKVLLSYILEGVIFLFMVLHAASLHASASEPLPVLISSSVYGQGLNIIPTSITPAPDGSVYVGSDNGTIIKLDANGNQLWSALRPVGAGKGQGLAVDSSGNVYSAVIRYSTPIKKVIIKYGPDGSFLKMVELPGDAVSFLYSQSIVCDQKRNILYAENDIVVPPYSPSMLIASLDAELNLLASTIYTPADRQGVFGAGIVLDPEGMVYVGGFETLINSMDSNYLVIASTGPGLLPVKPMRSADYHSLWLFVDMKIEADPKKGVVICTYDESSRHGKRVVFKVSKEGIYRPRVLIPLGAPIVSGLIDSLAVDLEGNAYTVGFALDDNGPVLVKTAPDGTPLWDPPAFKESPGDLYWLSGVSVGTKNEIYTTGFYVPDYHFHKYSQKASTGTVSATGLYYFSGDNQPVTINSYSGAMVSQVKDSENAGKEKVKVDFSVDPPPGATGHELTHPSALTDPNGFAEVKLKLGDIPAEYKVTAKCDSCLPERSSFTFTCCGKLPNDDFKQGDTRWGAYPYNTQTSLYKRTIGEAGCALTVFATAINYYANSDTDLDIPKTNPKTLNETLLERTSPKGFDSGHNVRFEVVKDTNVSNGKLILTKKVDWTVPLTDATKSSLSRFINDALLTDKVPVIAKVYRSKINPSTKEKTEWAHFILIVGKCGDKYIVSDPGSATRSVIDPFAATITEQSTHNTFGPIEGVRIFKKK